MKIKITILLILSSLTLYSQDLISPIPTYINFDKKKASLGKALFFDPILSRDKTISCATCHILEDGGDDNLPVSIGINGQKGDVNAPTVLNAVYNFRQFWDGRAKDLKEQAAQPIENPKEMGFNFKDLIKRLKNSYYNKMFKKIYKDGVTKNNILDAIAEYEKTLITPNSPFDRYLRGDKDALTKKQKEGYELFKTKGCITCHHGVNIGGNMFNRFGVFQDPKTSNLGRYNVTKKESDKYFFKVPTLRNIEKTAPYFHDGRTYSLKEAVLLMAEYQLGRKITVDEIEKIVSFLKSLTGQLLKVDLEND